jgi:hypothetical protein
VVILFVDVVCLRCLGIWSGHAVSGVALQLPAHKSLFQLSQCGLACLSSSQMELSGRFSPLQGRLQFRLLQL